MNAPEALMREQAAKALDLYCINRPLSLVHQSNARRIANELDLQVLRPAEQREVAP